MEKSTFLEPMLGLVARAVRLVPVSTAAQPSGVVAGEPQQAGRVSSVVQAGLEGQPGEPPARFS